MDERLRERARRAGVATAYVDSVGREVAVSAGAVEAALAAVGTPAAPALVTTAAAPVGGTVRLEGGGTRRVAAGDAVPDGVHRLVADDGAERALVVAPAEVPDPLAGRRAWGWQVQLYQLRSERSWGIGDYADLARLARAAAAQGAGVLLVNPLHARTPVCPVEDSPYYPSSRRYHDQLSIAIDRLPEYEAADEALRARVDALRPPNADVIDRNEVWRAKRAALELLVPDDDPEPDGFAVFCALAEEYGRDWREWPERLRRPGAAAEEAADRERVRLHRWLQVKAAEQLDAAQRAAREAGMAVGIVHDLAVGVDPAGADAWLLQDALATGTVVGAPPDPFNQLGQDWELPPLRPDRLAATGFEPYRQVVQAALRHSGGVRVDHVMGLFRLWWIPDGRPPADGTYVRYDGPAMLGILVLETAEARGLPVGEDLGTVEPEVRRALDEAGVYGSAVLWFAREEDKITPLPASRWRERVVASVSTHDLPTAYGFLAGEHVRIRAELGLLTSTVDEEVARARKERDAILDRLHAEGIDTGQSTEDAVLAMYEFLTRTPSRVLLASPADAVGDLRQPNLPGTKHEYPNWRLPLADGQGNTVSLEAFLDAPVTARLAALLSRAAPR